MEIERGSESTSFVNRNQLINSIYENKSFTKDFNKVQDKKQHYQKDKKEIHDINNSNKTVIDSGYPMIINYNSDRIMNSNINSFEKSKDIDKIKPTSPKEILAKSLQNSIPDKDKKQRSSFYQNDYSGTCPIDMFFRYNPGKTQKELISMLDNSEWQYNIDPAIEEEEKTILKIINEFYSNKHADYKICSCKYCKVLTLPFLLSRNIVDSKTLDELERKHGEYYTSSIKKLGISVNHPLIIPVHNIFMKKTQLIQVRITGVFEQNSPLQ